MLLISRAVRLICACNVGIVRSMAADETKQYGFKDGAMYISDEREQMYIKAWPDPKSLKRLWHNKWKAYSPEFRLISPKKGRIAQSANISQLALNIEFDLKPPNISSSPRNKSKTFSALRSTLPDNVACLVEPFRNHQWNLIRFSFYVGDVATDLLDSNPVLAFMLANHAGYAQQVAIPEQSEKAKKVASLKQKELLLRLKFPGTKSMVNLTKKIRPESVSPENLEALKSVLAETSFATTLSRMEIVNAGVLGIIANSKIAGTFDDRLLREISCVPRENYYPFTMHTLEEVCYMCKNGRPRKTPPVFTSLKRLEEFHDELASGFMRVSSHKLRYCKIPMQPLPGTESIVPLNTPLKIQKEGDEQNNCVGSYAQRASKGGIYIYKVLAPERATLSIVRDAGGLWRMGELRRDRNQYVSANTQKAVEDWLESHAMSA